MTTTPELHYMMTDNAALANDLTGIQSAILLASDMIVSFIFCICIWVDIEGGGLVGGIATREGSFLHKCFPYCCCLLFPDY